MITSFFRRTKLDLLAVLVLILSSLILLVDTLIYQDQPANMDGTTHVVNTAIFYKALSQGDFPVRWTDNFANYGLPIGSFAQQITSYLGGFFTFITGDVIVSFNWVYIVGTLASVLLFYYFLRLHFSTWPSFIGAFVFNFAPYRIINLYIRGAIPEYFSSVFFVLILIFLHLFFTKKTWWRYLGIAFSVAGLILSHPMNMVTGAFFIGPYILYLLWQEKNKLHSTIVLGSAFVLGATLCGYYILPLLKDIQYFYYGLQTSHYTPGSTLGIKEFFNPQWYYYIVERNEILSRGHYIKTGLIETLILLAGFAVLVQRRIKKLQITIFDLSVVIAFITLFFTTIYSEPVYLKLNFLSNIQFPWRALSTYIFLPPIIVAYLFETQFKKHRNLIFIVGLILVCLISWYRFPQLYSKNVTKYPQEFYFFTKDNLHSQNMNLIWTENTTNYPVHTEDKVAIIEGSGELSNISIMNGYRTYSLKNTEAVRMIDYTFYYPGWKVYDNGALVPIEYQDINYRGVITYWLNPGEHTIVVTFENTKTVLLANLISVFSLLFVFLISLGQKSKKISKVTGYLIE